MARRKSCATCNTIKLNISRLQSLVAFGQSGYDASFEKLIAKRSTSVTRSSMIVIVSQLSQLIADFDCLILFLLVILRQAFLEVLGAKGIQGRMITCPASCCEMRTASQAFTTTGSPQAGSSGGAIVTETVPSRTVHRSSSLRPSTLQALFAHRTAAERCLDSILTKYRVDPLERARFGEHLHQFRQRVLRLDLFRDVGDIREFATDSARRKKRQQTEEKHAPATVRHCAR